MKVTPSGFCGVWQSPGWWYYYLYVLLVKLPTGTLALLFGFIPMSAIVLWKFRLSRRVIRRAIAGGIVVIAAPTTIFAVASFKY